MQVVSHETEGVKETAVFGTMLTPNESPRMPTVGNPDGRGAPMFNNSFVLIGYVMPGVPLLVLEHPGTIYVKVLGPVGPGWVYVRQLKHL